MATTLTPRQERISLITFFVVAELLGIYLVVDNAIRRHQPAATPTTAAAPTPDPKPIARAYVADFTAREARLWAGYSAMLARGVPLAECLDNHRTEATLYRESAQAASVDAATAKIVPPGTAEAAITPAQRAAVAKLWADVASALGPAAE